MPSRLPALAATLAMALAANAAMPTAALAMTRLGSGERAICLLSPGRSPECWSSLRSLSRVEGAGCHAQGLPAALHSTTPALGFSGGLRHACALLAQGQVVCWGGSALGALGNGDTRSRDLALPQSVALPEMVVELAAGFDGACARLASGAVHCWGVTGRSNTLRSLFRVDPSPRPILLPGSATAIGYGAHHACAVVDDGSAWCWGFNRAGALGDGSLRTALRPVRVEGSQRWRQIAPGFLQTCALDEHGRAWCWGTNYSGQLGISDTRKIRLEPSRVEGVPALRQLASGSAHSCGIDAKHKVWCWGSNVQGAVGSGDPDPVRGARRVVLPGPASQLVATENGSCALVAGRPWCWGIAPMPEAGIWHGPRQLPRGQPCPGPSPSDPA